MRINELIIENFQGIRYLALNFDGKNANIWGDNGTGKTTVYTAVTWLLFDKASNGVKGFSPKTKDGNGRDIHNLNHSVTAKFRLKNGVITTFSKALTEVWKQKRGSLRSEFTGNTTEYQIDGVPVSEEEYNATIEGIISPERAKMLTMTSYFPEVMHWNERRKILLEICGDITDADVIRSKRTTANGGRWRTPFPVICGSAFCGRSCFVTAKRRCQTRKRTRGLSSRNGASRRN